MGKTYHICHLSLLNPAIHSRIFFKMARSQAAAGYRVSIIAQDPATAPYEREGVRIVPLPVFGRLSWRRRWALGRIGRLAMAEAADAYQIHTVELLSLARQMRSVVPNARWVYDMHEDYAGNILHANYYPNLLRPWLVNKVRTAEADFATWGDGLLLAEECFLGLMDFPAERTALAQNKFQMPPTVDAPPLPLADPALPMLLHTGTIAENWGVLRALELWRALNRDRPVNLVIAGHSQDHALLTRLREEAAAAGLSERFALVGGEAYLPFEHIVALIGRCDLGLALYDPKPNIRNRIPTKFYEFMAMGKPLLFSQNEAWDRLNRAQEFGKSLPWPLQVGNLREVLGLLAAPATQSPSPKIPATVWSWESESLNMLHLYRDIFTS